MMLTVYWVLTVQAGVTAVHDLQSMEVSKFWDLMINALKAADEVSPLNKK